jgi:hypothetical protein
MFLLGSILKCLPRIPSVLIHKDLHSAIPFGRSITTIPGKINAKIVNGKIESAGVP